MIQGRMNKQVEYAKSLELNTAVVLVLPKRFNLIGLHHKFHL